MGTSTKSKRRQGHSPSLMRQKAFTDWSMFSLPTLVSEALMCIHSFMMLSTPPSVPLMEPVTSCTPGVASMSPRYSLSKAMVGFS